MKLTMQENDIAAAVNEAYNTMRTACRQKRVHLA